MTWPGLRHLLITCVSIVIVNSNSKTMVMINVKVDGVMDKIDTDTMTLVTAKKPLQWNTLKKIKTPEGEALKCNEALLLLSKEDLIRLLKIVVDNCCSGDSFLDCLICHIEGELKTPSADVEGIFRVNGEAEKIKLIHRLGKVPKGTTVHDVASAFKQQLRELSIFDAKEQQALLNGNKVQPTGSAWRALKRLCRMISQHPNTRMTIESLAVCLAPALVTLDTDDMLGLKALPSLIAELLKQ